MGKEHCRRVKNSSTSRGKTTRWVSGKVVAPERYKGASGFLPRKGLGEDQERKKKGGNTKGKLNFDRRHERTQRDLGSPRSQEDSFPGSDKTFY